jgi:TM2 domain-containing membrane protein YozV
MSTEPKIGLPEAPVPEVIKQPPFVQPSHISDINHWKHPDRNFYVFIVLSFVFGFLGIDHFYLRSFGTGIQKFGFNLVSLGMWYFWDLIQIVSEGQKVQEEGLSSPFDWIRGIGRGVFERPTGSGGGGGAQSGGGGTVMMAQKDIFIYSMLTLMFGIFGLDKLYLGEPLQAVAKLLTCFNIFIFLFGWLWVVWDIVKVFLFTDSLMKNGISPPPPFSFMFTKPISAQELFIPRPVSAEEAAAGKGLLSSLTGMFIPKKGALPALPVLPDVPVCAPVPAWVPLLAPRLDPPPLPTDMSLVSEGALPSVPSLPSLPSASAPPAAEAAVAAALPPPPASAVPASAVPASAVPASSVPASAPPASAPPAAAAAVAAAGPVPTKLDAPPLPPQKGGGHKEVYADLGTPGPIIAGTLAAVVLAGAAKFIGEVLTDKK